MEQMKIVVLAGGLSSERNVSFVSGREVAKALRSKGHKVLLLDLFMGYGAETDDLSDLFDRTEEASYPVADISETEPDLAAVKAARSDHSNCLFGPNVIRICQMADIVFLALHGANGEDGRVQAAFDLFDIKYTGSDYLSSAIAMDKGMAKNLMRGANIPVPEGIVIRRGQNVAQRIREAVPVPYVIKPLCGGSSIGVSIVRDESEGEAAIREAFRWGDEFIVEHYIKGREFSVCVISGKALPVIEIAPKEGFYDYKNKYKAGSTVETCPADLSDEKTEEMQKYAVDAAKILHLSTYSRMDFLMDTEGHMYCLEANTLPGMTPTSLIPQEARQIGIEFPELCEKIIEISMENFAR